MSQLRIVTAGRIRLEPLVLDHALEMFVVLSDPAIYEFENDPPRSLEWLRYRYSLLEKRTSPDGREKWLNWAVRLSNTSSTPDIFRISQILSVLMNSGGY